MTNEIKQTDEFREWLKSLKDRIARAAISKRIKHAENGNFGDCKNINDGLWEMRLKIGPGYRLYYGRLGAEVYVIVAGGDKGTQRRHDIDAAISLWSRIKAGEYEFR